MFTLKIRCFTNEVSDSDFRAALDRIVECGIEAMENSTGGTQIDLSLLL